MKYYKYDNGQLEATNRTIISPNVVEITESEYISLLEEMTKQYEEAKEVEPQDEARQDT